MKSAKGKVTVVGSFAVVHEDELPPHGAVISTSIAGMGDLGRLLYEEVELLPVADANRLRERIKELESERLELARTLFLATDQADWGEVDDVRRRLDPRGYGDPDSVSSDTSTEPQGRSNG